MDKKQPPQDPPSYDESNQQVPQYQQGYSAGPSDEKSQYPPEKDPRQFEDANGNYQYPGPNNNGNYDPMNDPNVYKVPPQLVNITQANPEHLNPSYPQYQQREAERWAHGDFPKQHKHGAPLNPGKTNPSSRTGGSAFPGRGGATYNNAANK